MTMNVTFTVNNFGELRDQILALAHEIETGNEVPSLNAENIKVKLNPPPKAGNVDIPKGKRGRPPKAETLVADNDVLPPVLEEEGIPTSDQVLQALKLVNEKKGLEAAMNLIQSFGYERVSQVEEAKRADFISACGKLLA